MSTKEAFRSWVSCTLLLTFDPNNGLRPGVVRLKEPKADLSGRGLYKLLSLNTGRDLSCALA
eukprot:1160783-Pelagomonas_calceolata.AAC.7